MAQTYDELLRRRNEALAVVMGYSARLNAGEMGRDLMNAYQAAVGALGTAAADLQNADVLRPLSCQQATVLREVKSHSFPEDELVLTFFVGNVGDVKLTVTGDFRMSVEKEASIPAFVAPKEGDNLAEQKFYEWFQSRKLYIVLSPAQREVVRAFFKLGRAGGKTFLINLLKEYDR